MRASNLRHGIRHVNAPTICHGTVSERFTPANAGTRELKNLAKLAIAIVAAVWAAGPRPVSARKTRMERTPRVVLWSWERREDLSFIDTRQIAVAYLDRTLELSGNDVITRPRMQPLTVPRDAVMIAVARIETDRRARPTLSSEQRSKAARIIAAMAVRPPPATIQVDFDATAGQRAFYRDLLAEVRALVPASTTLSITALASWCADDEWIDGLPVDEIVPMLYRMGPDAAAIRSRLRRGRDFRPQLARASVGLSTDEELAGLAGGKRVYLFSPRRWTRAQARKAIAEVHR